jgi:CheY-specific phosphatase CheX
MMCSAELAENVSNNFLGIAEGSTATQRTDIISELTNVLAGQAYEILRDHTPPKLISPPELLEIRDAAEIWENSPMECRFVLCSETEDSGGLLVFSKDERSRP